jgi:hypothetical protein
MANVRGDGKRKQPVNAHKNHQTASGGGYNSSSGVNPRLDIRDKLRAKRQGAGVD